MVRGSWEEKVLSCLIVSRGLCSRDDWSQNIGGHNPSHERREELMPHQADHKSHLLTVQPTDTTKTAALQQHSLGSSGIAFTTSTAGLDDYLLKRITARRTTTQIVGIQ